MVPLLLPAVFASAMIVFAGSLDDFVVSQFLSGDAVVGDGADPAATAPCETAPSPALNALATIMLAGTMPWPCSFAWLVLRRRSEALSAAPSSPAID